MTRHLVTGGAGFLGSQLCERLLVDGGRVVALDDLSTGRRGNLAACLDRSGFRLEEGSVTDPALVDRLVAASDVVLHLAAVVGVRTVWEHPEETLRANVRGTQLVLDAAARHARRVLFASSSEVYGPEGRVPFHEDDPLLAGAVGERRWSYACSKAMGEWLAAAHARANGLDARVVRLFNVVGPRQRPESGMVLPRFVRQAVEGEPLTVYGDGRQTRTLLHVADAAEACLRVLRLPRSAERVFNVGGVREVAVGELAELVRAEAGSPSPVARMPHREAFGLGFQDPRRRRPDIGRLVLRTGFRPRIPLGEIVAEAVRRARRAPGPAGVEA